MEKKRKEKTRNKIKNSLRLICSFTSKISLISQNTCVLKIFEKVFVLRKILFSISS